MKTSTPACTLVIALLAAAALPADAQTRSFRCRADLVNLGDGKASALLKCGEPMLKDAFCKAVENTTFIAIVPPASAAVVVRPARVVTVVPPGSTTVLVTGSTCETVDEWTYNPGTGQFYTTLRFESGQLTEIHYGDRVK